MLRDVTRRRRRGLTAAVAVAAAVPIGFFAITMLPASAAVAPAADGVYTLANGASGKCVNVTGASADSAALLVQVACVATTTSQQWKVVAQGSNFQLANVNSTKCIDVPSSSTTSGTQLQQYSCGDATKNNQLWTFTASTAAAGKYIVKSVATGLCLSNLDGSTAGNNPIVEETCSDISRTQWSFNYVSGPTGAPTTAPTTVPPTGSGRQLEDLDRGVISVRSGSANLVSWRLLGTEATTTGFNVYRAGTKVNPAPITNSTNYLDSGAAAGAAYTVRAVAADGTESADSPGSLSFTNGYFDVKMVVPPAGTTPAGEAFTYRADDLSVGDMDGDGQYEIVVKWYPSNAKDNSQSGYTGSTYLDAYKLNGTRLWHIDLGRNIRSGAHYTQFQVYDYDGDGKAEVAAKTADGTRDGVLKVIGDNSKDYRTSAGYVLSGPEYLTMFNGMTGAAMSTVNYVPARGTVGDWGDTYGNRVDRFLAGTAYLDGVRPSLIMARGYYTRAVIAAWDFRNGSLTQRWVYDSGNSNVGAYGQGSHSLSIADGDQDGKDEIYYGAAAINDNGALLYRTGYGHGDSLHVGDFNPSRAGLEVFRPSESTTQPADALLDAKTGATLWKHAACGCDNGRGVAGDIYSGSAGAEAWSNAVSTLTSATGTALSVRKPSSQNFLIWWDGDTTRELLDDTHIDKYGTSSDTRLLTGSGVLSNNSTKATPGLSGDILGDWREEVIWRLSDSSAIRIYSTPNQTSNRLYTLMHDSQYRVAIAWQNTAYNQPPHPSYFIGNGMAAITKPNIYVR